MNEHYFSETPAGQFHPREIEVTLAGSPRKVLTAGSVFSPDHLDRGTEVLLRVLDNEDEERTAEESTQQLRILDLGCGWGAIALAAALHHPTAEVWAVDVNERARLLTEQNANRLGLTNIRAVSPDEMPETLTFTEIRSNPPIRVGKSVLHDLLRHWLSRLEVGGSATLVVAKHLGADSLQRWLAEEFSEFDVWRERRDKGFHVIRAVR